MESVLIQLVSGKTIIFNRATVNMLQEYVTVYCGEDRMKHYYKHEDVKYMRVEYYDGPVTQQEPT